MSNQTVVLRLKQQFKDILKDYSPSEDTVSALKQTPLALLLGVSGGGRNTIIAELEKTGHYHFVTSDTTRPPKLRDGVMEQDGVAYNFRKEEDLLSDLRQGKFIEAELIHDQQVSGISIEELHRAMASGKTPINEVDIGGTDIIAGLKSDTLFFFVVPPSFNEWLRRFKGREVVSDGELFNRFRTGVRILRRVLESDRYIYIVNDDLHTAVQAIDDYIHGRGDQHDHHNAHARELTARLLADTIEHFPQLDA